MYTEVLGRVPKDFVDYVVHVLEEFYEKTCLKPELLEVYIYESGRVMQESLVGEAARLGISVIGHYIVSHEAWMGWPRIHVNYEEARNLSREVLAALLVHEGAHSVLHGSISHYIISEDRELKKVLERRYSEAVYLASVVVKDMDVHRYLVEKGFEEHVQLYYEFVHRDITEISCNNIIEVLKLAKLVSPCIYITCEPSPQELLQEACKKLYNILERTLRGLGSITGNLSERVVYILWQIIRALQLNAST